MASTAEQLIEQLRRVKTLNQEARDAYAAAATKAKAASQAASQLQGANIASVVVAVHGSGAQGGEKLNTRKVGEANNLATLLDRAILAVR